MLADLFSNTSESPSPHPNWEAVIGHASAEELLPGLAARTKRLAGDVPYEILNLLTTAESLNAERNQQILTQSLHLTHLLNQINIQPIALKGLAYLLTNTYPHLGSRYLLDVDLLIPEAQLPRALVHLTNHGFTLSHHDLFIQFRHHAPELRRPNGPAFELHHQVGIGICRRLLPATQIRASATLAPTQDLTPETCSILIPSPTNLVNHLILHSQLAHPYHDRIFPPLRALVDLVHLQTRFADQIDWDHLAHTYRAHGQFATLALHLQHAHNVLGFPLPNFMTQGNHATRSRFSSPAPGPLLRLRQHRRQVLNRYPTLRFLDPVYLFMSLFSRRLRLLPQILQTPSAWPQILRAFTRPSFYRNLLSI